MSAPGPDATGTHWEVLNADGTPALGGYTSLAHGWATTATWALSAHVLGIRPISAGFTDWTMAPHPGDLDWAEGRVPTPDGPIDARWVREADTLTAIVVAPEGTRGTIALPASEGSVVTLDGVEVDDATTTTANGDTIAAVSVSGGRQHTVVVTAQAP